MSDDATDAVRDALAARGLSTDGTFAELEEKLVDAIASEQSEPEPDVSTMSIKELKEAISAARMRFDDCLDKADLRRRAIEALGAVAKVKASYQPMFDTAPAGDAGQDASTAADCSTDRTLVMGQVSTLSLKELKGLICESGLTSDGCTDKAELRQRACEALERLMVPGANCGTIGRPLVAELQKHAEAAASAKDSEAKAAKAAAKQKERDALAAAEAAAAAAEAEAAAAKRAREKAKRKEKKERKKENKAKAQSEHNGKEADADDARQEDDEPSEGEEESDDVLLRLASARLNSNPAVEVRERGSDASEDDNDVADAADGTDAVGMAKGSSGRALPSGWRVERGLLLEEGEAAPANRKAKGRNRTR